VIGNRDRQKNSDAGSVATVSWPVEAAWQAVAGVAAAVAMQQAMTSGTGSGGALQQVTASNNLCQ